MLAGWVSSMRMKAMFCLFLLPQICTHLTTTTTTTTILAIFFPSKVVVKKKKTLQKQVLSANDNVLMP